MTHLLWGLLNIGLFLFFIAICFNATKLIREKIGLFASVIFVFGLLSFIGHSNNDNSEPNSNKINTWEFVSEDSLKSNDSYFLDIDLEKTLVSNYDLRIKYVKDEQISIPTSAYSSLTGFVSGINWKPTSIIVNRTDDNSKFEYFVDGVVEWKLLGVPLYSQSKEYNGIVLTK